MSKVINNTIYILRVITESGMVQVGAWADPAEAAAVQATYPGPSRIIAMEVDFDVDEAEHLH